MIIRPRSTAAFFKPPPQPKRVGPRTQRRKDENRKLNKLNIRECEIGPLMGWTGCWKTSHLTWAHSKKSRFLVTEKDWQEAARACIYCHSLIEEKKHPEMERIIKAAIARRKPCTS